MTDQPVISVIIVTHNRKDSLAETVRSVRAQDYTDYEIIIVDNGSEDGTEESIRDAFPDIHCHRLDKNAGAPYGKNTGAEQSSGKLLFFIDDDARLKETDIFSRAVPLFEKDPDLAVVFGKVCEQGSQTVPHKNFFSFQKTETVYPRMVYTPLFLGGITCIRRAAFVEAGAYDSSYFYQAEEFDLSIRILDTGNKILFVPDFTLLHSSHPNHPTPGRTAYLNVRNYLITFWKNFPLCTAMFLSSHCMLSRLVSAAKEHWLLWYAYALMAFLFRLPAVFLKKRKPVSKGTVKRYMLLNSFPFEDFSTLEGHGAFGFWQFLKIHRQNRKERRSKKLAGGAGKSQYRNNASSKERNHEDTKTLS